ncbi:hypothetical protein Cylst_1456 [Cylindrospermum stagnale PCC 7417]|uniref:Uncharacterized protein n=1 Tax=Cylindrospermum stagnale PCC 7417 TaxID=56107 RepID=K9WTM6_9NOST|nr:hypothetical protein [Cylindrospermum stagnale]AFZ23740.1 hypothetical protein Cylst_1456 [Cylindrospermum stagnale PCC 7417]
MSLKLHNFSKNLLSKSLLRNFITATITISCGVTSTTALAIPVTPDITQKSSDKLLIAQSIDEEYNLKFESRGCRRINNKKVSCDVLITNIGNTPAVLSFEASNTTTQGPFTNAIDSSGTVYAATVIQMGTYITNGDYVRNIKHDFSSGIPTKITFSFDIPEPVNELAALDLGYRDPIKSAAKSKKRITIANIGTITSQSKTSTGTTGSNNGNCTCPNNSKPVRTNNRKR